MYESPCVTKKVEMKPAVVVVWVALDGVEPRRRGLRTSSAVDGLMMRDIKGSRESELGRPPDVPGRGAVVRKAAMSAFFWERRTTLRSS